MIFYVTAPPGNGLGQITGLPGDLTQFSKGLNLETIYDKGKLHSYVHVLDVVHVHIVLFFAVLAVLLYCDYSTVNLNLKSSLFVCTQ